VRRLRAWLVRLGGLVPSARRERELAEEIEAHVQMHAEDNVRSGMTPEEARRDAVLKLGGVEATKEACRERRTIPLLDNLLRDARFAIRQLRKNPGFSSIAVVVLALGLGASVAIFAFVDAALLMPLPYPEPSRLVGVYESIPQCPRCNLSYLDYLDWKRLNEVFASLEAYQHTGFILDTPSGARPARGARVSAGFFRTLGVTPILGRDFPTGEDRPGASPTVILSYGAWQQRFGGEADVPGRTVTLNGDPRVIVGVLPRGFSFAPAEPAEFWTALQGKGPCLERRSCHNLYGVARLKEGVSVEVALADTKSIAKRLEEEYPDSNRGQGAAVVALSEVIVGPVRPILLMLLGGAGLLLLIAVLNVASLVLVRSESRRRELAVRSAVGASKRRLVSQLATEALVLVAAGTGLGLALASWSMRLLAGLIPETMQAGLPFFRDLGLSGRVLAFAGAVALVAVVFFSLAPALRLALPAPREDLAEGGRGAAGRTWRRLGSPLVVLELATAMVLLIGAGLLGQSLYRLLHVELGLRPDGLALVQVVAPDSEYPTDERALALGRRVVREIEGVPGVTSAGLTSTLPVGNNSNTIWFRVLGRPYHGEHNDTPERDVSAGYLNTLGATLLEGRHFREDEDASQPQVAIVNQSFARQYFPGEDPIGKRIAYVSWSSPPMEIVGVVKDVREGALDSGPRAVLYRPFEQSPGTYFGAVVRTSRREDAVLPEVVAAIHRISPGLVTAGETTMTDLIGDSPSAYRHRSTAWLVGSFAALALLLSLVGLYGVIAFSVSQRTREIGVRMALGAERRAVYRLVLGEAGRLSALGIALGTLGSLAAAGLLRGLLFGVRSWDVPTLGGVAVVLGLSAVLASYVPARRAASVDPVEALRAE
jgi:macrolide transport system ATP-binding/permease protein